MAIILRNSAGDFILNNRGWGALLRLAYDFGWRPLGTQRPALLPRACPDGVPVEWNPADYFSCRGQFVTPADATALAEALDAALDDIPNHDPFADVRPPAPMAPGFPHLVSTSPRTRVSMFEVFAGPNKARLREFIAFCRVGGFFIW